MFWSKIWFFLVAVAAAIAVTIALVLPRPASRALVTEERNRLTVACGVVQILLTDDARKRVDLAGKFARQKSIVEALEDASNAATLDDGRMKTVRSVADGLLRDMKGGRVPDFAVMIDRKGRVVARVRLDDADYGDVLAGRPLVDDALAGYQRDDLWVQNGTMYFLAAAPVVRGQEYFGAILLGHKVTNEFANALVDGLKVGLGFYLGGDTVASSPMPRQDTGGGDETGAPAKPAATQAVTLDPQAMQNAAKNLKQPNVSDDCQQGKPISLSSSVGPVTASVARLPGEALRHNAYYTVLVRQPAEVGFAGTLNKVSKADLSPDNFPWVLVGGGFLIALAGGIGLMLLEADRPLRRLTAQSVRLAKGEVERLSEDAHPGKFGSIARSVNIHIDKLGREAKVAKSDLDQLLGPAPEGSLGTIDLLATPLPASRPGGPAPAVPPPPSDFRFGDSSASPASRPHVPPRALTPAPGTATPPPAPPIASASATAPKLRPSGAATPPPVRATPAAVTPVSAPLTLDDDILGSGAIADTLSEPDLPASEALPGAGSESRRLHQGPGDAYFRQVFDQFVSIKKSCNEPTSALTFEKFAEKLVRNRDDLKAKTGCKEVRFTVYIKDGKAALKATPVKED